MPKCFSRCSPTRCGSWPACVADAEVDAGLAEVDRHQLRMAVGEVQQAARCRSAAGRTCPGAGRRRRPARRAPRAACRPRPPTASTCRNSRRSIDICSLPQSFVGLLAGKARQAGDVLGEHLAPVARTRSRRRDSPRRFPAARAACRTTSSIAAWPSPRETCSHAAARRPAPAAATCRSRTRRHAGRARNAPRRASAHAGSALRKTGTTRPRSSDDRVRTQFGDAVSNVPSIRSMSLQRTGGSMAPGTIGADAIARSSARRRRSGKPAASDRCGSESVIRAKKRRPPAAAWALGITC